MNSNLFTPFQGFAPAFHYLFTLDIAGKPRKSTLLQKTFSLFMGKIYRETKMSLHNQHFIADTIKEYLLSLAARKYSKKSIVTYEKGLNKFTLFLGGLKVERVQNVSKKQLESFRSYLVNAGLADNTIYIYLRSVRNLFGFLEDNQQIFLNPAQDLEMPQGTRKLGVVPREEEIAKILAQPNPSKPVGIRDRALIEVAYSCGLRKAELAGLTIFDPDIKQGTLRIVKGKGKKERVVPLGKQAVFWLKKYQEKTRPHFCKDLNEHGLWIGKYGAKLSYARIGKLISEYAAEAGLANRVTPHALRRACATHMLRGGAHPVQVQMLLGHANLANLSQYLQVTITDMKKMHKRSKPGR